MHLRKRISLLFAGALAGTALFTALPARADDALVQRLLHHRPYWLDLSGMLAADAIAAASAPPPTTFTLHFTVPPRAFGGGSQYYAKHVDPAKQFYEQAFGEDTATHFGPIQPNCLFGSSYSQLLLDPRASQITRESISALSRSQNALEEPQVVGILRSIVAPGMTVTTRGGNAFAAGGRLAPDKSIRTYCAITTFTRRF